MIPLFIQKYFFSPAIKRITAMPPPKRRDQTTTKIEELPPLISLFTDNRSFKLGTDLHVTRKKNETKIEYKVLDITPIFQEVIDEQGYQMKFRDGSVIKIPQLWIKDYQRSADLEGLVQIESDVESAKRTVKIRSSEPHLVFNDIELTWHYEHDVPSKSVDDFKKIYKAPLILEKLRMIASDDRRVFNLLLSILTQTSYNDMYDTVLAHIGRQDNVTMINTCGESRQDLLNSTRYRGYRITMTPEKGCKITAIIAGYFHAASPNGIDMFFRADKREVGWYRCVTEYDLENSTAVAEYVFKTYPKNWETANPYLQENDQKYPESVD